MIDLEDLASQRAKALRQEEAAWLVPLKDRACDVMCSSMSDGEIAQVFTLSQSAEDLAILTQSIAEGIESGEESAFSVWKNQIIGNGMSLEEGVKAWGKAWAKNKKFAQALREVTSKS